MKRIYTLIVVFLGIGIASSFSSKPLGGIYCGSFIGANSSCAVISNIVEDPCSPTTTNFWKYSSWSGSASDCLTNRCATIAQVRTEP